jgi:hypothetical protein
MTALPRTSNYLPSQPKPERLMMQNHKTKKYGNGFQHGPKPRMTVLAKASSNLPG